MPHSKGDDTRSAVELEALRSRDPLVALQRQYDAEVGDGRTTVEQEVDARIARAVAAAEAAVPLDPHMLTAA